ncbi:MAG: DUF2920 family protein [Methylophilales bacterium]|nr:DUF2920 family protein [Methylophilales bacterium]
MQTYTWENEHYAHSDVELNITRQSKLVSYCTAPWKPDIERPYAGMVMVLHGYGQLGNDEYIQKLREYLAEKYSLLAVSVNYHASGLHTLKFHEVCAVPEEAVLNVLRYLKPDERQDLISHAAEVAGNPEWIKFKDGRLGNFLDCLDQLEKLENKTFLPYLKIFADNLDHQNFGVLQALDILTVVYDVSNKYALDKDNVLAFGSSHGGYLAHLCSKFAPNTFRAVIEGSSYPYTPYYFIANRPYTGLTPYFSYTLGDEKNPFIFTRGIYFDSLWEIADNSSPTFFGYAPFMIRNLNHAQHWEEALKNSQRHCQYRMIHSSQDQVFQPLEDKRNQVERLVSSGFDVEYREMVEVDVDGKLVKHLDHGMGSSLRALFDLYYPSIKPTESQLDNELGTVIDFQCGDKVYRIDHANKPMLKIL